MHAKKKVKMMRGAIWASAIPISIGLIGLVFYIHDLLVYDQHQYFVRSHHFLTIPFLGCFLFGTPLAAWIACSRLRKIQSIDKLCLWRSSAISGGVGATIVHVVAVLFYSICIALFVDLTAGGYDSSQADVGFVEIVFRMLTFNLIPWLLITLPLSLICATIFWRVTEFPDNTSVF